ncbi:LysR family transcriptional regulator [Clostridium butyricum]|uniref:LysR family transcriptional regulator n=1 Tax=Clostridium butyricum TaxID=1492 RepID=UPI0021048FF9|nr:LysR family transcriptional regulator [Clostridium butyricum]MCQ2012307.1 LysR family transcriptional regulator [Clostridium butyricum]MCQ2024674.1 LysR family transcriptional regulator [Clostridium butyricum]
MIVITIEQIQYFLAVKKYNGFSPAAHELCISQSSLSKQIKSLETELDTILFDRTSRITKLTCAGEDFYVYALKFLDDYNKIIQGMKKHSISKKTTLNIGTIAVISQYGLASVLASFKSKYPNIDINIFEEENEAVLSMLKNSEIDLAIVRDFNLEKKLFNITHIADDELVVVTSNDHPFTKKKYISFGDLKHEDLIICSKSGVYDICLDECSKLGFTPKVIYNINKIETILGLVSEGLGITLIVNNVLKPFSSHNIAVHPLKDPINSNLALVSNINTSRRKEINAFREFLLKNSQK